MSVLPLCGSYDLLLKHLHDNDHTIEIDILPSHFPSPDPILFEADPPALAISRTLLCQCFLIAHQQVFPLRRVLPPEHRELVLSGWNKACKNDLLHASSVLLLWDPNNPTAINIRRRRVIDTLTNKDPKALLHLLRKELIFLASLLTSPLPKHTKSPALWSYRLWLLNLALSERIDNTFPGCNIPGLPSRHVTVCGGLASLRAEMEIVMKAGTQHPRNYYAWHSARQLTVLFGNSMACACVKAIEGEVCDLSVLEQASIVREWCFRHPSDISGWTFCIWLLQHQFERAGVEARHFAVETQLQIVRFQSQLNWKGESLAWASSALCRTGC